MGQKRKQVPVEDDERRKLVDEQKSDSSNFVASMTFANIEEFHRRGGGCDCDECGVVGRNKGQKKQPSFVPNAIQRALDEYRRKRPLQRTADRRLLETVYLKDNEKKSNSSTLVTLWQWTLPTGAVPLLEFGDSHRLVWVKNLNVTTSRLQETGVGVIGSQQEEQSRVALPWQRGHVYYVPSRKGKAIGWIHESQTQTSDNDTTTATTSKGSSVSAAKSGPVVLYVVKIPSKSPLLEKEDTDDSLENEVNPVGDESPWSMEAIRIINRVQQQNSQQTEQQCHVTIPVEDASQLL